MIRVTSRSADVRGDRRTSGFGRTTQLLSQLRSLRASVEVSRSDSLRKGCRWRIALTRETIGTMPVYSAQLIQEREIAGRRRPDDDSTPTAIKRSDRILVLTAAIGAGHISTALACKRQLEDQHDAISIDIDEPIGRVRAFRRLPSVYRFMTAYVSPIWALFYYSRKIGVVRKAYGRFVRHRLRSAFDEDRLAEYGTVIITYSMYCNCLDIFKGAGLRAVVLVTDLFGGPDEWFVPGADQYIVPTSFMAAEAEAQGIEPRRVLQRRLPTLTNWPPQQRVIGPSKTLSILVIGGSEGLGPLRSVASGLLRADLPVAITVVCGNNDRLLRRLARLPVLAQGFVPEVAATYRGYDFVVTKPGSVTIMELLEQDVPFALLPGIAGIEAGNSRMLKRAQVPMVGGCRAARRTLKLLVAGEASRSQSAAPWLDALQAIRHQLPEKALQLHDFLPAEHALREPSRQATPEKTRQAVLA